MNSNFCLLPSAFCLRLKPVRPQPLRDGAHHRLVLRAVAEEDVVGEGFSAHG